MSVRLRRIGGNLALLAMSLAVVFAMLELVVFKYIFVPDDVLETVSVDGVVRYQAGTATANDLSMLNAEAGLTGETLDDLAASILANAAMFRVIVGKIAGFRRQTKAALEAATPEQYPAILTAAKAAALADAAAMGLPVVL